MAAPTTQGGAQTPLRLCADPANLPFSAERSDVPGLYVEVGQAIAKAMGREAAPVWTLTYFGKRALRTTMLEGQCDLMVGLPQVEDFMGPRVIFSKPVLTVGYALVAPKSAPVSSIDELKGKRVAVQFGTNPQSILAPRDDVTTVTFLDPDTAMHALAKGEVDAAFIWGPTAGWLNKSELHDGFSVVALSGPGLQWPAAVGFDRSQTALRDAVNDKIDGLHDAVVALEAKYGFPTDAVPAVKHAEAVVPTVTLAADQTAEFKPATSPADIAEGKEIFNGTCSHCHGPDAVQEVKKINLRLLHHRYGDKMDEVFHYTVTHGRPDKGMPNWSEVFTEEQFAQILGWLHTVQDADTN